MDLLKGYDVTIQYHPGKVILVADTVGMASLAYLSITKRALAKKI